MERSKVSLRMLKSFLQNCKVILLYLKDGYFMDLIGMGFFMEFGHFWIKYGRFWIKLGSILQEIWDKICLR